VVIAPRQLGTGVYGEQLVERLPCAGSKPFELDKQVWCMI